MTPQLFPSIDALFARKAKTKLQSIYHLDVRQSLHHNKGNVFRTQHMFYLKLFAFSPALLTTTCDVEAAFSSLQTFIPRWFSL